LPLLKLAQLTAPISTFRFPDRVKPTIYEISNLAEVYVNFYNMILCRLNVQVCNINSKSMQYKFKNLHSPVGRNEITDPLPLQ